MYSLKLTVLLTLERSPNLSSQWNTIEQELDQGIYLQQNVLNITIPKGLPIPYECEYEATAPKLPSIQTIAALLPDLGLGMAVVATANMRILAYSFSYSSPTTP